MVMNVIMLMTGSLRRMEEQFQLHNLFLLLRNNQVKDKVLVELMIKLIMLSIKLDKLKLSRKERKIE